MVEDFRNKQLRKFIIVNDHCRSMIFGKRLFKFAQHLEMVVQKIITSICDNYIMATMKKKNEGKKWNPLLYK